jgi:uroporphyrinogen-III synthase
MPRRPEEGGIVRTLAGHRIAVPETRELDRLARMLEERGASSLRCPLVAIRDVSDPAPIEAWLRCFAEAPFNDLVLLTGEGVRRLHAVARRAGLEHGFLDALRETRKIARGPKPGQALRELGLKADIRVEPATTGGIVAALSSYDLKGRSVGVQLYPDSPNTELMDFLASAEASPAPVLPYIYASEADECRVVELIDELADGRIDVIAFTSSPQVRRLFAVAKATGREAKLETAMRSVSIAAVGPVVEGELRRRGLEVAITPTSTYFMKPLVSAIEAALQASAADP